MSDQQSDRWVGYLRGSRTGTLYLVALAEGKFSLSIGFTGAGDLRLDVISTGDGKPSELRIPDTGELFGSSILEHETGETLRGTWNFISGAAGTFELNKEKQAVLVVVSSLPQQLRNRETPLGAITLYRADLDRLIAEMESLVPAPNITTIRATENRQIVIESAETYLSRKDYVDVVRVMTISTTEINDAPLKRIANVNLNDDGSSQLFITSPDEIWTTAVSFQLEKYLSQFSSRLSGFLRRKGLSINTFILFAILIWMPDKPLAQRIIVFVIGVALITLIAKSHSLVPYNRVYLDPSRSKKPFAKELPSASLAAAAGLVTAALSSAPRLFEYAQSALLTLLHNIGF